MARRCLDGVLLGRWLPYGWLDLYGRPFAVLEWVRLCLAWAILEGFIQVKYIVAIGDIHGELDKLNELLKLIGNYFKAVGGVCGEDWRLLFVGDYIDRGPESKDVIETVRMFQKELGAICIRGNHEQMAIDALDQLRFDLARMDRKDDLQPYYPYLQNFLSNGGYNTILSYGNGETRHLDFDQRMKLFMDIDWMATLPLHFETDLHYFCHAGIEPFTPLNQQTQNSLLWIRDSFLRFTGPHPKYIVHGHSPVTFWGLPAVPDIRENRCNVDTGGVFKGALSAAIFAMDQKKPVKTFSVG